MHDTPIAGFGESADVVDVPAGVIATAVAPQRLLAPALGSCVAVALYDPVMKRGGMAHVMLPRPADASGGEDLGRFAEYAVPHLIGQLVKMGSLRSRIVAKIAGGAAMFRADSVLSSIGERNVSEVKRQLALLRIPILAEDTGGRHARTVEMPLETGVMVVRSYMQGTKEL